MDKVISSRIDSAMADKLGALARRLNTSKKNVLECAIEMYAAHVDREQDFDVLDETCGAWSRKEPATATVEASRKAFRDGMHRHVR